MVSGTTITFSSSDAAATYANGDGTPLPGGNTYTFTAADNGTHVFMVTFRTRGMNTSLSVLDPLGHTGSEGDINVV
jgi:hypothetical protein